jgi:FkbM family methyltransferase
MIATLRDAQMHLDIVGIKGLTKFLQKKVTGKIQLLEVTDKNIRYPFYLRIPSSDTYTYHSIILNQDYQFKTNKTPQVIIDAGANIGLASIYFANQYPQAKVIAIEPETENFQLLKKNVAPYPNIIPLQAALWHTEGKVHLGVGIGSQDGFMTEEIQSEINSGDILGEVESLTIDSIMSTYDLEKIDILKVDIEGAEKEVFGSSQTWIDKVDSIVVELHERMKPGCNRSFYNGSNGFTHEWIIGENVCLSRGNFILPTY